MQIIQKLNIKKLTLVILIGLAIITSAVLAFTIHNNNLTNATTITNIAPDQGPTPGGTEVTITGTDFMHSIAEWKQISAGADHTCAIASDNQAYCWGYNNYGQLGNNSTTHSPIPVAVDTSGFLSGLTIKQISTGAYHTCAIASDDQAYCWGQNYYGQLGNSSTTDSSVPVALYTYGVLIGKTIKSISASGNHTCAIASDNNAYCWGSNQYGQLGNGYTGSGNNSSEPTMVNAHNSALVGKTILSISAGGEHTCAIASDDQAYCWGQNYYGQLGNSSTTDSSVPVAVDTYGVLAGLTIKQISAGSEHTCAIASDDQAYCWGANHYGQLGNGLSGAGANSPIPVAVDTSGILAGKTIESISVGSRYTCAIASDDQAYCWGSNYDGQLGNGLGGYGNTSPIPVPIDTSGVLSGKIIKQISAGGYHTCAIASDDQAYCWGQNYYGQLGNSSTTDSSVPVAVDTSVIMLTTAITSVKFGGVDASSFTVNSDTSITVIAPPHVAGTVDVTLTTVDNQIITLAQGYTYYDPAAIASITPNYGPVGGETSVTISGSGFSDDDMAGYDYSVVAKKAFYTARGKNITGYLEDGSEIDVDTSALVGDVRQLPKTGSEVLLVLDDAGKIYYKDANHTLVPIDGFVTNYPAGILDVTAFTSMVPVCNSLNSCNGIIVTGEDGLYGSLSFSSYGPSGSFSNQNYYGLTCDIDAYRNYALHCTDETIYYNGQAVSLADVSGEFDKFVASGSYSGGLFMTTKGDNKPYYLDTSDYTNYKMIPVDMSQFAGDTIVMVDSSSHSLVISDETGALYQVVHIPSSTSVPAVEPYNQPSGHGELNFASIDGVINRITMGTQFGSSANFYYVTTTDGRFFTNDQGGSWSTYSQIPVNVPAGMSRSVVFDSDGVPAECTIDSWSDTEIKCTTTEHDAGLVSVVINNGAYHSAEVLAAWDNSGIQDRDHIASGFLYEEYYVSLAVDSDDVDLGALTPNANGVFGSEESILSVKTNYQDGYSLAMSTDKASSDNHAVDMKHASFDEYIVGAANTCIWNASAKTLTNTNNALSNNTWGFTLNTTDLSAQKLCQVPSSSSPLTIKSTTTANETAQGDQTSIYFGVKVDTSQAAGQYEAKTVYTVVGNI